MTSVIYPSKARDILMSAKFPWIIFSTYKAAASRMIKYWTDSSYSHASICWEPGVVLDSRWGLGVQFHDISEYLDDDWYLLKPACRFNKKELDTLRNIWLAKVGSKYDKKSVIAMVIKTKREKSENFYCTELIDYGFNEFGYPLLPRKSPCKTTPELLLQSWRLDGVAKYDKGRNKLTIF